MSGGAAATIHLDTPSPGASSGLPAGSGEQPSSACATTLPADPALHDPSRARSSWPCFGWGLPSHSGHPECWCALTAPFHPYHRRRWRSVFCGTFPRVTSDCRWQSPRSVKSGLSSTRQCEPRSPSQLVRDDHCTRCTMSGPAPGQQRPTPLRPLYNKTDLQHWISSIARTNAKASSTIPDNRSIV
jgi:hypothetical protein